MAYPASRSTGPTRKRHKSPRRRQGESLLTPARGSFLLTLAHSIALAFDRCDFGMMQQPIQQGNDASGVGKDFVPLLERPVGGQNHRLSLIAPVHHFIKKISGLVVK